MGRPLHETFGEHFVHHTRHHFSRGRDDARDVLGADLHHTTLMRPQIRT